MAETNPPIGPLLEALTPPGAALVVTGADVTPDPLLPEEESAVARAVEKRRREFALGRSCARRALGRIGVPPVPIPVGENRAPAWPHGVVGSITHGGALVAALVAPAPVWAGLGIDAEVDRPIVHGVMRRVCTPAEIERLARDGDPLEDAILVFSAKEAIYKAIAPIAGRWIGFQEVEVELDPTGRFTARYLGDRPEEVPDPARLDGWWVRDGGVVVALTTLPHGGR